MSLKGDSARFCPERHKKLATKARKSGAKVRTAKAKNAGIEFPRRSRVIVEHRVDDERLKRVAEMSPEEMRQVLRVI
jgi:hypothetical protein